MNHPEKIRQIIDSPSYRLAFEDVDFLKREDLRPVRFQLELLKPERIIAEHDIESTIVVFGSARLLCREEAEKKYHRLAREAEAHPQDRDKQRQLAQARLLLENAHYYEEAREFSRLVSSTCQQNSHREFVIVTGGGPGIMEAANRGAYEVGAKSIGLNITLPHEQAPNPYITPSLCFQFKYFALRKMHFRLRAKALVAFPGGFGTCDELFETLTLIQTSKMEPVPILLFGKSFWQRLINFPFLAEQGMISYQDLNLMTYVETAAEAWHQIVKFYQDRGEWPHPHPGKK
ncbi:MAG: TIGR00730 family Rossman fold protein [bacterium]